MGAARSSMSSDRSCCDRDIVVPSMNPSASTSVHGVHAWSNADPVARFKDSLLCVRVRQVLVGVKGADENGGPSVGRASKVSSSH